MLQVAPNGLNLLGPSRAGQVQVRAYGRGRLMVVRDRYERISREELYALVWREPMLRVAERFGVSSTLMAQVCRSLDVPRPSRGHWAKLSHGKHSPQPPLPPIGPGVPLGWRRGEKLASRSPLPKPPVRRPRRIAQEGPGDRLHPVLVGAAEVFASGRLIEQDFLKPGKRQLADVVVSKGMLGAAFAVFNELLHGLEQDGYPVMLAPKDRTYWRSAVDERESPGKLVNRRHPALWSPSRPTLVFVGTVAIGLTLFELTETKEARRVGDQYLPLDQAEKYRPRSGWPQWSWTIPHAFATGRLCLQVYSPYPGTHWIHRWVERKPGELCQWITRIIRDIAKAAPRIASLVEGSEREAEKRRREWELERQRIEEQEQIRRREKAKAEATQQLLEIMERWGESQRIQDFFSGAENSVSNLPEAARCIAMDKLAQPRELVGELDPLQALLEWKGPRER